MNKKMVIVMAGAGAAGKSTTTKAFAIGEPQEHREERVVQLRNGPDKKKVVWTIYDNCALTGNHKSGTDANTGPGLIREVFQDCMASRDITIVDGFTSSPQWVEMINEWADSNPDFQLYVVLLHFNLDAETLLDRLAMRRGEDKETFRERMEPRCIGLVRRAELLVGHFANMCEVDYEIIEVLAEDSTEDIVDALDCAVCDYFQDCEE